MLPRRQGTPAPAIWPAFLLRRQLARRLTRHQAAKAVKSGDHIHSTVQLLANQGPTVDCVLSLAALKQVRIVLESIPMPASHLTAL